MAKTTKQILHVVVGDSVWEPTSKELRAIERQFRKAISASEATSVIATRSGVELSTHLEVDTGTVVKAKSRR